MQILVQYGEMPMQDCCCMELDDIIVAPQGHGIEHQHEAHHILIVNDPGLLSAAHN